MSNTQILCLILVVPWLSLPFMKKDARRRFMPSAFFSTFICTIAYEAGILAGFWYHREIAIVFLICGLFPVTTLWVILLTYRRFWVYMLANALVDLVFAFVAIPWLGQREILGVGPWSSIAVFVITVFLAFAIYQYQKWQERGLAKTAGN